MSVVDSMTEPTDPLKSSDAAPADVGRAGAMLRAARQQKGLHIAALAASIKVTPAKLEALESGRYQDLLDPAFTRALAQAVCRALKIDPAPVLAQLPDATVDGLGRVGGGLNTPFRERPGRVVPADWAPWRHPVLWLVALLLLAAVAFQLWPSTPTRDLAAGAEGAAKPASDVGKSLARATASGAASGGGAASTSVSAGRPALPQSATSLATGDAVVLRARQATWVQAVDGNGQTLVSRLIPAGETLELTVKTPLRLKIGNVGGTELQFRGKLIDLGPVARDNKASLTLP